jgi:hypothetical protein
VRSDDGEKRVPLAEYLLARKKASAADEHARRVDQYVLRIAERHIQVGDAFPDLKKASPAELEKILSGLPEKVRTLITMSNRDFRALTPLGDKTSVGPPTETKSGSE